MGTTPRRPQGTGSLFQRGPIWYIQYYRHGKKQRESTHSTDRDAAQKLLNRRLGLDQPDPEKLTIGDLIDLVLEDYEFRGRRSIKIVRWVAEANVRPALGHILASNFGSSDIKWYVAKRRRAQTENATINRELAIVSRGFRLAAESDPPLISRVPKIPHLEEDNVRQGFLEPDQYRTLLQKMPERLKALFVVGYHVGGRKGELRKLQWHQVDLAGRVIRMEKRQTKTKQPRTIPIYGDMGQWLLYQRERCPKDCPWVFFYRGRSIGAPLEGWKDACTSAGVPGLLFHDLRRSAVRNMKRAGVDDKIAMQISGHKTRSMYERYDIVNETDIGEAAQKMEVYLNRRKSVKSSKLRRVK